MLVTWLFDLLWKILFQNIEHAPPMNWPHPVNVSAQVVIDALDGLLVNLRLLEQDSNDLAVNLP